MKQFIIRRLIISVFILLGVSMIIYALVRLVPGDFVSSMAAQNPDITPDMVARLQHLYGLDTNIAAGYAQWLSGVVHGDFGVSFVYKRPVAEVIASKMWVSFSLAFVALVFQLLLSIPLGIVSAVRQYSRTDYAVTVIALLGISMPSFFFAALLQRFFALQLQIFPLSGMVTARADFTGFRHIVDLGYHFVLPVLVFVVTGIGGMMRYVRTNMLEVLDSDYIRTARAKGLPEKTVIYHHAFRNTLIPIVTLAGGMIPGLFSGAIITEGIFAIDGLGLTAFNALKSGDIPFIMGFNMFLAVLTLLGTLTADILYAAADPRVRLQ